jgi:hypothetical protein
MSAERAVDREGPSWTACATDRGRDWHSPSPQACCDRANEDWNPSFAACFLDFDRRRGEMGERWKRWRNALARFRTPPRSRSRLHRQVGERNGSALHVIEEARDDLPSSSHKPFWKRFGAALDSA